MADGWWNSIPIIGDIAGAIQGHQDSNAAIQSQEKINQKNADMQKEFAQNGIQWRVADAVKAGLSPLAAIGTSGASFSPSYQVGATESGPDYARMGQDVSRAASAMFSKPDKQSMHEMKMDALQEKHGELENAILLKQLGNIVGTGPGLQDTQTFIDSSGTRYIGPSDAYAAAAHGSMLSGLEWDLRNRIINPLGESLMNLYQSGPGVIGGGR